MEQSDNTSSEAPPSRGRRGLRSRTSSPPKFRPIKRNHSIDPEEEERPKKDFHSQNLARLSSMKKAREAEVAKMTEEKEKLERMRVKMRQKVLDRIEEKRLVQDVAEAPKLAPAMLVPIEETEEELLAKEAAERAKRKEQRKKYKSRQEEFLKNIAESRKAKQEEDERREAARQKKRRKLTEELGFNAVSSKLYAPTVSSNNTGENIADLKSPKTGNGALPTAEASASRLKSTPAPDPELTEEEKEKQKAAAKETQAAIRQRAQDNLAKIAEKRANEERKKKEASEKQQMKLKKARDAVLNMRNTAEPVRRKTQPEPVIAEPAPKKMTREEYEAVAARLSNAPKRHVGPIITDTDIWRKKHKLGPKDKIYILAGGYGSLRKALDARGWYENKERDSPCFDLKWTCKSKHINHNNLADEQRVNHFVKAHEITSKVGIARNIKRLSWFTNSDPNTFFPRNYDLCDDDEYADFIEDFKLTKAECILKDYAKQCKYNVIELEENVVETALTVCNRRLTDLDDLIDMKGPQIWNPITEAEWEIIAGDEHLSEAELKRRRYEKWLNKNVPKSKKKKKIRKKKKQVESSSESEEEVEEDPEAPENPLLIQVNE